MNKCQNCGTEFEGKFCPECGTRYAAKWRCPRCGTVMQAGTQYCPECGVRLNAPARRAPAQSKCSTQLLIYQALCYVPAALLILFSALLFAIFAAPVIEANGLFVAGSENLYEAAGDASLKDLHATLYALIAFACLGAFTGAGIIYIKWEEEDNRFFEVFPYIIYAVTLLLGVITIIKVKDLDKQASEGLGLFTAGSCATLVIVFSVLFALFGTVALIARKMLLSRNPELPEEEKKWVDYCEKKNRRKKKSWIQKHVKLVVSLSALAVAAIVLCSLIPTFKLMAVNGTYYYSRGGEPDKAVFVTLKTGKWTDEKGNTGKYEVKGKAVILYSTDQLTGLQLQLNGAVQNGVLTVGDAINRQIYVKENHKHKFGEWETVYEPMCVKQGTEAHNCICGFVETKTIAATGTHNYSNGKCIVCNVVELKYKWNSDTKSYTVTGFGDGVEDKSTLIIPSTHENMPVTSIGDRAFDNCSGLTSVKLKNGQSRKTLKAADQCNERVSPCGLTLFC